MTAGRTPSHITDPTERRDHAAERDDHADARDTHADQRDTDADQRDVVADRRDTDADRRDTDADQRDTDAEQRDTDAEQRDTDAERRDADAEQREPFAPTRHVGDASPADPLPALSRTAAASGRLRARVNRRAGATVRIRAEIDRGAANDDRTAGAAQRTSAEYDRTTAVHERAASTGDRHFATQLAGSLGLAWTLRQLDPPEYLYVSPGMLAVLGWEAGTGLTLAAMLALIHPDDPPEVVAEYLAGVVSGAAVEVEMRIVRQDGAVRWIRSTSYPVTDDNGIVVRSADTVEDITPRKSVEAVGQARQLEAERANAAKSEFLFRMSHELRTPLNAVMGFAQIIELDPLSKSQEEAVGYILRSGRHLLEMINEALDIARIESDQVEISAEPVLVRDLLADTIGLMRPLAAGGDIEIRCDLTHRYVLRYVLADPRRLLQALINLLSNAVKYNKPGGQIDVSCQVDNDTLKIIVADTGIGIRPDHLPRLFVPFDRLGGEGSGIEGTGIGLSVTQHLVTMMGGRIDVRSEFGHGATFTVVMPMTEAPA